MGQSEGTDMPLLKERTATAVRRIGYEHYVEDVRRRARAMGVELDELLALGERDELEDDRLRDLYLEASPILRP